MKRFFLLILAVATLVGCRSNFFTEIPEVGNSAPIYPMHLVGGTQHCYLTDYFPQWVGADKVTVSDDDITLTPTTDNWSEFDLTYDGEPMVTTLEAWRDGRSLSVVLLSGKRDNDAYMFTTGAMMHIVSVATTEQADDIVAMWQNCPLPEECIIEVEGGFGVIIPKDSEQMERSYLRIYASTDEGLFNDIMVPLAYGDVVKSVEQLNRHDNQAQVLYSLMIDRFYNGNTANDKPLNRKDVLPEVDYQGGDLKGITEKIREGFFEDLGVNTIWISPITQNPYDAWGLNKEPFTRFSGYHGYWPIYTTRIDDRFGTDEELREMLATAHEKNMNVILDYVANHMHINSPVLQANPDWTTPLILPDGRRNLELWDDQRLTTWFDVHIPTLDLEREEVCEPMTDSALYWIANYDFDGFRHDACKHIPENYWRMLCHKMKSRFPDRKLWQIGETYGDTKLIGSYVKTGMIDAQFDFKVYHTAIDVFLRDGGMKRIRDVVAESTEAYGSHHTMGNITGNHDKARFISLAGGTLTPWEDHKWAGWNREVGVGDPVGYKKLGLLTALITTIPGVPCIYQGDEYGIPGGNDPDNRHMMVFDGYNEAETAQKDLTRSLVKLRRESMPMLYGDLVDLYVDDNVWAFARAYMGEYVIVVMNNSANPATVELTLPAAYAPEQELHTNFGGEFVRHSNSKIAVTVPANGCEVLTK